MDEIKLDVQVRKQTGTRKSKVVRRQNFIPGVVYGSGRSSTVIQVERKSFERIMRGHQGENVIFHLNVAEGETKVKDYSAIAKEIQFDPVDDRIMHIDFHQISLTKKIEVEVSIVPRGEAVGVKQDGGALEHILWKLDVVCLPTQIPQHIEVDISNLKLHDAIHVKDLVLPPGVITKHDPEAIVLSVVPPMKEIAPEEAAAVPSATEPEVIKEKPKEKKEGEAAPAAAAKSEGK